MTGPINLYNIYVGDYHDQIHGSNSTIVLMDYLATHIGNSSWYDTVTNYYQINSDGSKTYASHIVNFPYKSVNVIPKLIHNIINEEIIINIIKDLFHLHQLPVDTSGIYAVMFRGDLEYNFWTDATNTGCGYHYYFNHTDGKIIKFFVAGDVNYLPRTSPQAIACAQVFPVTINHNWGADSMASVYAHELAEIVTDWDGAWSRNNDGLEISDVCNW
eukprot:CAMPEP_0170058324 /NCGR_PEP_ID=MMETSP0019_2-20121128/991_1 /TAXON_ID=98059 /ORGANISM="Dinobryon sp., Strain UTEXLB2267" /LENGTH=215 /DNA_ID=CAMNT_0010263239 /DNA_START=961 /DNA_END=1605 /DNA_ORIENTATION=-